MDYFKKLWQLLEEEKKADLASFKQVDSQQDIGQKRTAGQLWYPIAIKGQEIGRGDYLNVELNRTTHLALPHQFRYGVQVALFSNHDLATERIEGTVVASGENWAKINFRIEELPDWADKGKLGLELLFDQYSYGEMESTLKEAAKAAEAEELPTLAQVLLGLKQPSFGENVHDNTPGSLNPLQEQAVVQTLSAKELSIIHGPPGTGKTTTLVAVIQALLANGSTQLLVTAPSNAAVDLLTQKLAQAHISVIRIGNPVRVNEEVLIHTLDHQLSVHPMLKDRQKLRKQAAQLREMAHKYKRKFGPEERAQRKALFDSAHQVMRDIEANESAAMEVILNKAQVIIATLVGTNHPSIRKRSFHTVLIDEAAQALEPACWIPVLGAQKLIMAGDPQQLPPTVKSSGDTARQLMHTLMQKAMTLHPETVVSLQQQYRMHQDIMAFPSKLFYDNHLSADPTVATRTLWADDLPLQFIDTAGCGFEEKEQENSLYNPEEAAFTITFLQHYLEPFRGENSAAQPSVGVISPYRAQVEALNELAAATSTLNNFAGAFNINTIDSFQGQERDIICISLCRSNPRGAIGFLADIRRMNVAMTRARKKLVIIGDSSTLTVHPFYRDFIKFCEENGFYQSAWEYMEY